MIQDMNSLFAAIFVVNKDYQSPSLRRSSGSPIYETNRPFGHHGGTYTTSHSQSVRYRKIHQNTVYNKQLKQEK